MREENFDLILFPNVINIKIDIRYINETSVHKSYAIFLVQIKVLINCSFVVQYRRHQWEITSTHFAFANHFGHQ